MTGRAAALQGGLAALGLITAHFTWQREPERAPGDVVVIDASKSELSAVRYEDDKNAVDFTRGSQGGEPTVFMHLVVKKTEPPPTAHGAPKGPPPPVPPARDLMGGDTALKLFDRFAPLLSPRAFGVLDVAKLKELGLDAPKRKLVVTVKGDNRQYEIGQPATTTAGESFLRDSRDGRVYLMPRGMLSELQNAAHLVDRRLHTFNPEDYDRLVVTAGGKTKEFAHLGKESAATEAFAPAKTPDKRDQMAKNWHDSLWRTFPMEVLGKGENPKEGAPKPALKVEYYSGKKQVGWLELGRTEGAAKTTTSESPSGPTGDVFARTEHTVGWAKLHSGAQLITDAEKLAAN